MLPAKPNQGGPDQQQKPLIFLWGVFVGRKQVGFSFSWAWPTHSMPLHPIYKIVVIVLHWIWPEYFCIKTHLSVIPVSNKPVHFGTKKSDRREKSNLGQNTHESKKTYKTHMKARKQSVCSQFFLTPITMQQCMLFSRPELLNTITDTVEHLSIYNTFFMTVL